MGSAMFAETSEKIQNYTRLISGSKIIYYTTSFLENLGLFWFIITKILGKTEVKYNNIWDY
jgi:hypothetical protein